MYTVYIWLKSYFVKSKSTLALEYAYFVTLKSN